MNTDTTVTSLKQEIIQLHKQISKVYAGDTTTDHNVIKLIQKLSHLSTEYKKLKSHIEQ